jgi:acyl-CoA thioester hydrolase
VSHSEAMKVRDYECDMQGVVNNAVYQNYLEHARHEFLKSVGLDFAQLTREGINLVVVRAELDYRWSLRSGDTFEVRTRIGRESRLRFVITQQIRRCPDERLILDARITCTAVNRQGRPQVPVALEQLLAAQAAGVAPQR